jgi:hypothetical protein
MVPGEAVMRELLHAPAGMPLAEVLEPLTYRALVCKKSELHKLDSPDLRSALPWVGQTRLAGAPEKLASVPGAFKALMRYDVAGLFNDLIPVSDRAVQLKKAYGGWVS